jgi:hypothetical protein
MRMRAKQNAALAMVLIAIPGMGAASPQNGQSLAEARSILREAAKVVPAIDSVQQASAANNIALEQLWADELAGARATLQALSDAHSQNAALSVPVYPLGIRGDWQTANRMIEDFPEFNGALAYRLLAGALASRKDFEHALRPPIKSKKNRTRTANDCTLWPRFPLPSGKQGTT